MPTRSSTPRDANQVANDILAQVTGDALKEDLPPVKNEAAVALGRLGGKKGGAARAKSMSPERRVEIARKAARARWAKLSNE